MENQPINVRKTYLDVAKGILIYIVFLGHIADYLSTLSTLIFAFHMPAFFIINGYLCGSAYEKNFSSFIIIKLKTYLLPYFLFAIIGAVIHICWGYFIFISRETAFSLLITCQPDELYIGAGWFLISALWGNIFLYLFLRNIENRATVVGKTMLIILIAYCALNILELTLYGVSGYGRMPWKIDSGLMAFIFMLIGFYSKKYDLLTKYKGLINIVPFIIYYFLARANGWVNLANCSYNNGIYYFASAICGTYVLIKLSMLLDKIKIISIIIGETGKLSLPMFMLHGAFLSFMNTKMGIVTGTIPAGKACLFSFILVIIVYPFAKIFSIIYKKIFMSSPHQNR